MGEISDQDTAGTPVSNARDIAVIDDDQALRESLVWLLGSVGMEAEAFADGERFLASPQHWKVILLDVRMPGLSGLQVQQHLVDRQATTSIIMMTGHGDVPMATQALRKGAYDFIEKPFNHQQLIDSLQGALAHAQQRHHNRLQHQDLSQRFAQLRPKEQQIVTHVAQGMTSREIAEHMAISAKTVEVYRQRAMKALGANNLAELIRQAVALGLVAALPDAQH